MKKTTALMLLLIVSFAWGVLAQDKLITRIDRVTGGALVETNVVRGIALDNIYAGKSQAWELRHVAFTIPEASFTNTFSITHEINYRLPDIVSNEVVTTDVTINGATEIVTNTYYYSGGLGQITNVYTVATVTNETGTQYYDTDDFPKDWVFEDGDKVTYSFSYTGRIDLIRVFRLHARP